MTDFMYRGSLYGIYNRLIISIIYLLASCIQIRGQFLDGKPETNARIDFTT